MSESRTDRHRRMAQEVIENGLDLDRLTWTPDALIFRGGGSTVPMGRLKQEGSYSWSHDLGAYQRMVPDWHVTESAIFPSEEGVAIFVAFEGTAADNVRARSLGLANQRLRLEDAEVWFTNEDFEITKHVQEIPRIEAAIALCFGTDVAAEINGGSGEAYIAAVQRFMETGQFVDPDQPAVAQPPSSGGS